jgi:hypothetical protein
VSGVFAGEVPWSPRFEVRFSDVDGDEDEDEDEDNVGAYASPALGDGWLDEGIGFGQAAVELSRIESDSATALKGSYGVPSFELARRFELRQLPGTLDLVGLDGVRASATHRADEPWTGRLLFVRRDLVVAFAGERRILQVGWGERALAVGWGTGPSWLREVHQRYEHVWRDLRIIEKS